MLRLIRRRRLHRAARLCMDELMARSGERGIKTPGELHTEAHLWEMLDQPKLAGMCTRAAWEAESCSG